jgi:hypothetical protein
MPEIKLSKVELAALDLLIAELQEAKVRGPLPPTVIVTRVLTTLTRTLYRLITVPGRTLLTRRTMVTDLDVGARRVGRIEAYGKALPARLTLKDLIELRKRAGGG